MHDQEMSMSPALPFDEATPLVQGVRLRCQSCGSEIEIVTPCGCNPPNQEFRCCGEDMTPAHSTAQRLDSE
jgi:hypothetical protein